MKTIINMWKNLSWLWSAKERRLHRKLRKLSYELEHQEQVYDKDLTDIDVEVV
jgi:hypothetical protein